MKLFFVHAFFVVGIFGCWFFFSPAKCVLFVSINESDFRSAAPVNLSLTLNDTFQTCVHNIDYAISFRATFMTIRTCAKDLLREPINLD